MDVANDAPLLTNSGEDRTPGVHLSDILSRMAWDRDRKYRPDAPKDLSIFEAGFTWETVLGRALAARHGKRAGYRVEPFQEDGIWLSPDWVAPDQDIQVEEWKSTRKSLAKADEKVAEWGPQIKAYLRALLRRGIAKRLMVRLRVWFIMGDWSFESKSDLTLLRDYYRIDIEFDKRELEENWRAIVSYGQKCGLLKEAPSEETWQTTRKKAGRTQPRSHTTARVGMSLSTKRSSKLRDAS